MDKKDGFGIFFWRSGDKYYEGQVKEDLFHGIGILYDTKGEIKTVGRFEKGIFKNQISMTPQEVSWKIRFAKSQIQKELWDVPKNFIKEEEDNKYILFYHGIDENAKEINSFK